MSEDRRNDLGNKIIVGVFIGVISLLLSLFINAAWTTANEGKNTANEVQKDVSYLKARLDNIQGDLIEIKDLLKRKIPTGG